MLMFSSFRRRLCYTPIHVVVGVPPSSFFRFSNQQTQCCAYNTHGVSELVLSLLSSEDKK